MGIYLGETPLELWKDVGETVEVLVNGDDAFIERTLTEVYSEAESVGDYALRNCGSLISVDLPKVTNIGDSAFGDCSSLLTVNLPLATIIGNSAFSGCTSLTSIDLPLATSVDTYAFKNCKALTSIDLPLVTSISDRVFWGCVALTSIDLPVAISISDFAFGFCSALASVILRSETMVTLDDTGAFDGTPIAKDTGYVYVPSALVTTYQADSVWSTYSAQFRALENYTVDGTITGELDPEKI